MVHKTCLRNMFFFWGLCVCVCGGGGGGGGGGILNFVEKSAASI